MSPCIACDIDGTLADDTHRKHFLRLAKPDWSRYYGALEADTPYSDVLTSLRLWSASLPIALVTGRPESYRGPTIDWLSTHEVPWLVLLMRADRDPRANVNLKLHHLDTLQCMGYRALVTLDDFAPVIAAYHEAGVPAIRINHSVN